jgi:hypothetical protein
MLFDTKGHCFERDIIMLNGRWYLSYKPVSCSELVNATERYMQAGSTDRRSSTE